MPSFLVLQTSRLWEIAMFTMCAWMLEFTEPMSNVNLISWPSYRNPLSRGITMTFPLLDTRSLCDQRAFPLGGAGFAPCSCCCQSVVCSLCHLLLEVLPCHSFPQHVLPCWTPAPLQFLLARACAFTAVVLCSHAGFFLSLSSHLLQWENHNKSLQLEAQTYQRIQEKIQERVMNNLGTWIDWQYLQNAAKLLAKVSNCLLFGTAKRIHARMLNSWHQVRKEI